MAGSESDSSTGRPQRPPKIPANAFEYVSKHQPSVMARLSQASTTAVVSEAPPAVPRKKPASRSRRDSDAMPSTESESEPAPKRQKKGKNKVDNPEEMLDIPYDTLTSDTDRERWLLTMLRVRDSRDYSDEGFAINNLEFLWLGSPNYQPPPSHDAPLSLKRTDSLTVVPGDPLPSFKKNAHKGPSSLAGSQPVGGRPSPWVGGVSPVPAPPKATSSQARVTTRLRILPPTVQPVGTSADVTHDAALHNPPSPDARSANLGPPAPDSPARSYVGEVPGDSPPREVAEDAPSSPAHASPGPNAGLSLASPPLEGTPPDRLLSTSPLPRPVPKHYGLQRPAPGEQEDESDDLPEPEDIMMSDRELPKEKPKRKSTRRGANLAQGVPAAGNAAQADANELPEFEDAGVNVPVEGLLTMRQRSQRRWFGRAIPLVDRLAERLVLRALTGNPFADCTPVIVDNDEDGVPIAEGVEFDQIVIDEWMAVNHEMRPGQLPFKLHEEYRFNVKQVYTQIRNAIKAVTIGYVKTYYKLGPDCSPKDVRKRVQNLLDDNFHSSSYELGPNEFKHKILADTIGQAHFAVPGKSIGYRFAKHFKPMPRPTIALHCTIIYFLITTFSTGHQNQSATLDAEIQRHWFKYYLDQLNAMAHPKGNPVRMSNIQRRLFKQVYQVEPVRKGLPRPRRRDYDTDSEEEEFSEIEFSDDD